MVTGKNCDGPENSLSWKLTSWAAGTGRRHQTPQSEAKHSPSLTAIAVARGSAL